MYLVDTSVWIDYLQGRDAPHVRLLDELLANPLAVGINDAIYLEILQGARDLTAFDTLRRYFSQQRFYRFDDPERSHALAARLYLECRRCGVTVRSTLDCLIAQCALDHDLVLLHNDRDYRHIASICPELRQRHFLC
ncbi:MAG: VapC toxin family PIN domain ribonuclease [Betaproteobacteria bacterium HGW-Betaproteobacteria-21]|nr:MAG: VapC toxin family PIN domain ribonuclease [Betaproteobacteria bacterium HGW-Betaproteobacteria-21]